MTVKKIWYDDLESTLPEELANWFSDRLSDAFPSAIVYVKTYRSQDECDTQLPSLDIASDAPTYAQVRAEEAEVRDVFDDLWDEAATLTEAALLATDDQYNHAALGAEEEN